MTYEFLLFEQREHVALITLNNPGTLNSLYPKMRDEILDVCERVKHDDSVRAVVFTGAGRGFCSGAHVGGQRAPEPDAGWDELKDEYGWVGRQAKAVYELDKPTIAAVNGIAAGAGMSLALACDIRVGSEHTRFKTVFIERSLSPDSGMSYFLPRIVGSGNALDLILTSRAVGAEEALRMGLLSRVFPADSLVEDAIGVAEVIAGHPPIAAQISRRVVQHSLESGFDDQLKYERSGLAISGRAREDAAESRRSFIEKRKPTYYGR